MKAKSLQLLSLSLFLFFNVSCFDSDALERIKSGEKNLAEADLENAKLSGKNLSRKNFREANLKNAWLNSTILQETNFERADLTKADLSAAKYLKKSFDEFTQDTNLFFQTVWCGIKKTIRERKPSLYATKKSFQSLVASFASFAYFLQDITFPTSSNFIDRNRIRANFAGVHAQGANFSNTYLMQANFEGADLRFAQLKNAILFGANLKNAILDRANLKNVLLEFANVEGASFDGATGLTSEQKHYLVQHGAINVYSTEEKEAAAKRIQKNIKRHLQRKREREEDQQE